MKESIQTVNVALAGNPNSGKTSIFNALTGARQHVGNYPGVTVEKREGIYRQNGHRVNVVDLPGTYSLASYSPEERITEQQLLSNPIDVVVVVVDSTALKRSLVLLTQIMQLGANPVLCLNMADEAKKAGQKIDVAQLQTLLGIPVVETVGHKAVGINELKDAIERVVDKPVTACRLKLGDEIEQAISAISNKLQHTTLDRRALDFLATALLTENKQIETRIRREGDWGLAAIEEADKYRERVVSQTGMEITLFVTERFYGFVDGLLREVVQRPARADAREVSDRIDTVLAHRIFGLPFFLLAMYLLFYLTFTVGEIPMGWIEGGIGLLSTAVTSLWPAGTSPAIHSLVVDGVIAGVGGVLVFLPNILLLFLGLAVLEDTGYMARVAFLVDRFMHRFGLHGKSFIPMLTGFGCSIPGIMATRTLENERDRLTTMLVLPLMSCGARLPIWMLLVPAFFPLTYRAPMLFFIYIFGIVLAFMLALLLRKSVLRGEDAPFVMELPPYRIPTLKALLSKMFERGWLYLRKAGTVILALSILIWICLTYPKLTESQIDAVVKRSESTAVLSGSTLSEKQIKALVASTQLENSIAGRIGYAIEPLFSPLGFDWKITTAIFGAFAAKEVFISQMGIVYALGETDETSRGLREVLSRDYSPLAGLSLILFLLIATPCMATIAVTRRESGSWKWALLQLFGLTAIAYLICLTVFQIGRLFFGG